MAVGSLCLERICMLQRHQRGTSYFLDLFIFYIHPELRIKNCRSCSEKGAGSL